MKLFSYLFLLLVTSSVNGQIITTVAGNGTMGYSGDGGPALIAQLGDMYYTYPAFDNAGNMYIAQNGNNTIRKIDAAGIITTIAGKKGIVGYSGDGGPALNALLYHPTSIAIDNANNIYFADRNGEIIRKISPSGIITTVSGQQTLNCGSGDGGPLALAQFQAISALAIDQFNNLYISDFGCCTIRKVNSSGIINTIAGNGTQGYSGDGGPATQAQLAYPCKVAVDNTGNIYIPDTQNHRIRKISVAGIITTFAGNGIQGYSGDGGPAISASMSFPGSIVIDNSGNFFIGDYNQVIRKIDASGTIITYAGNGTYGYSGDGGPAIMASIALTEGRISINHDSICFVNYQEGNVIRKIISCMTASIIQQPINDTLCNSGNAMFSIKASNSSNYLWQSKSGTGWTNLTDNNIYSGTATSTLVISGASTLMNNFQYRCSVVNSCGTVYSAVAVLSINSLSVPTISIFSSDSSICESSKVTFTASITNGGASPLYRWTKNGFEVGSNSSAYTDMDLKNGDVIACTLISNSSCIMASLVSSNLITVIINKKPVVEINQINTLCEGSAAILDAGIYSSYLWNTGSSYEQLTISNIGEYAVMVTDSNGCTGTDSLNVSNVFPSPKDFFMSDTSICANGNLLLKPNNDFKNYLWNTGSNGPSIFITQAGKYWVQVEDNNGCKGTDTIQVMVKDCMNDFFMPSGFTPNNDGNNDNLKPLLSRNLKNYQFWIYNRWGQLIFYSTDSKKGWDGNFKGLKQESNVFVWMCSYQFEGDVLKNKKGSVVLIR